MQLTLDLAHSAPPIPFPTPAPRWTHTRFLESVRANMLRRADELETIARTFQGLPAAKRIDKLPNQGVNLPAFQMSAEHRQEIRASVAAIRATYGDPTWLARELAGWNLHEEELPIAA
jgi:hypothetical protein